MKACQPLPASIALVLALSLSSPSAAQRMAASSAIDQIRHELLQLPYYGVFDFLAFSYDSGTVTLMGYASTPTLPIDAERAVERASGVACVTDKIEVLPMSLDDNELRWAAYYVIYRDPLLARYAPGSGQLWGHRHTFPSGQLIPLGPIRFLGTEPAGDYPIHIIVRNARVTLLGVVDSELDKARAGELAVGVPRVRGVENELSVDTLR